MMFFYKKFQKLEQLLFLVPGFEYSSSNYIYSFDQSLKLETKLLPKRPEKPKNIVNQFLKSQFTYFSTKQWVFISKIENRVNFF